jgi:hypothetical protein
MGVSRDGNTPSPWPDAIPSCMNDEVAVLSVARGYLFPLASNPLHRVFTSLLKEILLLRPTYYSRWRVRFSASTTPCALVRFTLSNYVLVAQHARQYARIQYWPCRCTATTMPAFPVQISRGNERLHLAACSAALVDSRLPLLRATCARNPKYQLRRIAGAVAAK